MGRLGWSVVDTLPGFISKYFDRFLTAFGVLTELSIVDAAQQGSLPLKLALRKVQFTQSSRQTICTVSDTRVLSGHPRVFKTLIHRDSLVDIHRKHPVD